MDTNTTSTQQQTSEKAAKKDLACGLFGQRIHRQSDEREAAEPVPA